MQNLVICFVDTRETQVVALPNNYGELCRMVASMIRRNVHFRIMTADHDNNLMPISSERSFGDAVRLRPEPKLPLRVFVKQLHRYNELDEIHGLRDERPGTERSRSRYQDNIICASEEWKEKVSMPYQRNWAAISCDEKRLKDYPPSPNIMPKEPSLAELVYNIQQKLDAAFKSVHLCVQPVDRRSSRPETVESTTRTNIQKDQPVQMEETKQEKPETVKVVEEDEGALTPRPSSSLSSEFMVVTPRSDSCPVICNQEELEAAFAELDSEFEVMDGADGCSWDSDVEWQSVSIT